eukprot:CAMPEP_0179260228 /NCGR_PEP_ID=MMETSP0797-20121207/26231_1 /TAXON_ID=47934 /ORGANISM="Dinophysis acuminata, Strain DAEP01" /LENGTH=244 /DNA_ID=CAMNT_0020968301 /DNA_START=92 /DNA_END=826 /DNA_ORIENTATION=+
MWAVGAPLLRHTSSRPRARHSLSLRRVVVVGALVDAPLGAHGRALGRPRALAPRRRREALAAVRARVGHGQGHRHVHGDDAVREAVQVVVAPEDGVGRTGGHRGGRGLRPVPLRRRRRRVAGLGPATRRPVRPNPHRVEAVAEGCLQVVEGRRLPQARAICILRVGALLLVLLDRRARHPHAREAARHPLVPLVKVQPLEAGRRRHRPAAPHARLGPREAQRALEVLVAHGPAPAHAQRHVAAP